MKDIDLMVLGKLRSSKDNEIISLMKEICYNSCIYKGLYTYTYFYAW